MSTASDNWAEPRPVRGYTLAADSGQGTVEFAVVMAGLLSIIIGLGALWHLWDQGIVVSHALRSASHVINASLGWIADVFVY